MLAVCVLSVPVLILPAFHCIRSHVIFVGYENHLVPIDTNIPVWIWCNSNLMHVPHASCPLMFFDINRVQCSSQELVNELGFLFMFATIYVIAKCVKPWKVSILDERVAHNYQAYNMTAGETDGTTRTSAKDWEVLNKVKPLASKPHWPCRFQSKWFLLYSLLKDTRKVHTRISKTIVALPTKLGWLCHLNLALLFT